MSDDSDLDLIFPMNNVASARFMLIKAECLLRAEVIDRHQFEAVAQRAALFDAGPVMAPAYVEQRSRHYSAAA
ncbi:MAG TPA: hypothetical protein VE224_12875 [Pseudolabrys sp.]|nr:hypothetical protein [Pseudolabrys sp.]